MDSEIMAVLGDDGLWYALEPWSRSYLVYPGQIWMRSEKTGGPLSAATWPSFTVLQEIA